MSYIRCLSNPEGLYVWGQETTVEIAPGHHWKHTNIPKGHTLSVPTSVFHGFAERHQHDDEGKFRGFEAKEVVVYESDGKPVPKQSIKEQIFDKKRHWFAIRVSYRGKWVLLWRVTWEYLLNDARIRVKKTRRTAR